MFAPVLLASALSTAPLNEAPRVASYQLQARLDATDQRIDGEGSFTFTNPSEKPTKELFFHLYLNAFENDETLFLREGGNRSGWADGKRGSIEVTQLTCPDLSSENLWLRADPHSPGDPKDRTDIRVPLPRELAGNETLSCSLKFVSQLPKVVERTGFAGNFYFVAQWFPKLAKRETDGSWAHFAFHPHGEFYADFGNYEVLLDVPEEMVVASTGNITQLPPTEAGRSRYTASAANVHDFAWTAWESFEVEERSIEGVKIRLLTPPHVPRTRVRTWKTLEKGLRHLGEAYGAYPHPQLSVVHPPAWAGRAGGMEYPQLITTGGMELRAYLPVNHIELLTIHELAHQWFQGTVASNEMARPFLDEGFTSYAEWRYLDEQEGALFEIPGFKVSRLAVGRFHHFMGKHREKISKPAPKFKNFRSLAALVYARTALSLTTLARTFGESRFHQALGTYARQYRFKHPNEQDFYRHIERELGAEARSVAEQMFETTARSDLKIDSVLTTPVSKGFESEIHFSRGGKLALPFEAELQLENGRTITQMVSKDDESPIRVAHDSPALFVHLDPKHANVLDENLLNNRRHLSPPSRLRTRAAAWNAGAWLALLLSP